MLQAGHTTNVSFKVNVMGTGTEPKVRLILGTTPELSFVASKGDGDTWGAEVLVPKFIDAGSYDFRVEVVLNNRLFTPLNKRIEIAGPASDVQSIAPEVQAELPPVNPTPTIEPLMTVITAGDEKIPAPEMPKVQAKFPKVVRKDEIPAVQTEQTLADVVPAAPPLSLLKNIAEKPAKRMYERIVTPLPKPGSVKVEPIRIHISEIDSVTAEVVSRVVETVQAVKKPVRIATPRSPVRLVKEELFYA